MTGVSMLPSIAPTHGSRKAVARRAASYSVRVTTGQFTHRPTDPRSALENGTDLPIRHAVATENRRHAPVRGMGPTILGGRYWVRTSDLLGVNEALYH